MANDFVADPMNRVKPGDIVSVRVISIDEKRGRIGFSMKPESEKPVRTAAKSTATSTDGEKVSRPRSNQANSDRPNNSRSAADKRSSKPRGKRQDNTNSNRSKPIKNDKAQAPSKMGTLGALLQEAGVTKTKK